MADEWMSTRELAARIGLGPSVVNKAVAAGEIPGAMRVPVNRGLANWYVPASGVRLWQQARRDAGRMGGRPISGHGGYVVPPPVSEPSELLRLSELTLLVTLVDRGGQVTSDDGRASAELAALCPVVIPTKDAGTSVRGLELRGLVVRSLNHTRMFAIDVTEAGRVWVAQHAVYARRMMETMPPRPESTPEPEPEPEPEPSAAVEVVPVEPTPPPVESAAPTSNGHDPLGDVSAGDIARALLRQTTRLLADGDVSTLTAERDALRAHNTALVARNAELTDRAERAEREARDVRRVLAEVEARVMPLVNGSDHQLDLLDARTRTDLITVISEAAAWAL